MPLGGLLALGTTGAAAAKHIAAKKQAERDRALAVRQMELSPYTGRTEFQKINEPNIGADIAAGIGAGALASTQQFGSGSEAITPPTMADTGYISASDAGRWATPGSFSSMQASTDPDTAAGVGGAPNRPTGMGWSRMQRRSTIA